MKRLVALFEMRINMEACSAGINRPYILKSNILTRMPGPSPHTYRWYDGHSAEHAASDVHKYCLRECECARVHTF